MQAVGLELQSLLEEGKVTSRPGGGVFFSQRADTLNKKSEGQEEIYPKIVGRIQMS